ncbi:MAG TPA: hypothetical protein VN812_16815, partial [Candidatus Acidoferrales bacterium]|nr:hypothetical protein [Candidatus Acidoferrales bacterium]
MRHSERRSAGCLALILAGCLAGFSGVAMAANLNVTWNGGSGNWEDPTKWGGGVVPNNGPGNTFNVFIDGGNGVSSAVTLYTSEAVSTLTIDQGDQLIENNGSALGIAGGPAINNGVWALNTTGATTDIWLVGGVTVSGTGSIVMNNALFLNNRILTDGTVFTQAAGHMIRGSGQLLVDTGGMINLGTVIADQPAGLWIDPNDLGFTNQGLLQAKSSGTLTLKAGTLTNTGGIIEALDLSRVEIQTGATVVGGEVRSSGTGVVAPLGGTLANVTTGGTVQQDDAQAMTIIDGLINNATWTLSTTGHPTDLNFIGGATLSGTGSIVMSNALFLNNRILTDDTVLTQAAGHTIRGSGQLLADTGGMVNQGTIIADQPNGLVVDPNDLSFTNQGLLQAMSGGTLTLTAGTFVNTDGIIEALDGAEVQII